MIARIYRSVLAHVAVLVEVAKRRKGERLEFDKSDIAHPEMNGWEDDPDTLRNLPAVIAHDEAVEVPESGRHSRGSAA